MGLGLEQAIAEVLRDGDPARGIDGLDTLEGFRLYDDPDVSKQRIYIGEEPPTPDETVSVFLESGGQPISGSAPVGRRPGFTVRSRSLTYERSLTLGHEVDAILNHYEGNPRAIGIFRSLALFEPTPLGRDRDGSGGRWITTQTYSSVTKNFALS